MAAQLPNNCVCLCWLPTDITCFRLVWKFWLFSLALWNTNLFNQCIISSCLILFSWQHTSVSLPVCDSPCCCFSHFELTTLFSIRECSRRFRMQIVKLELFLVSNLRDQNFSLYCAVLEGQRLCWIWLVWWCTVNSSRGRVGYTPVSMLTDGKIFLTHLGRQWHSLKTVEVPTFQSTLFS